MTTCMMICTAEDRVAANLLGQALGHGADNYSVALSSDGTAPATHYGGYHAAEVGPAFVALVEAASQGAFPAIQMPDGAPEIDIPALFGRLIMEFNVSWQDGLALHNLTPTD